MYAAGGSRRGEQIETGGGEKKREDEMSFQSIDTIEKKKNERS